ncbi:conserved hypothetical protein [Ricinus communis]|uniref:Uncharacterized protein n=1 Tax=Ricinus communis TaxID=3988 RepID=B9RIB4_RICCO|nr:conserved hypothetical protein [Ricinus communis]
MSLDPDNVVSEQSSPEELTLVSIREMARKRTKQCCTSYAATNDTDDGNDEVIQSRQYFQAPTSTSSTRIYSKHQQPPATQKAISISGSNNSSGHVCKPKQPNAITGTNEEEVVEDSSEEEPSEDISDSVEISLQCNQRD